MVSAGAYGFGVPEASFGTSVPGACQPGKGLLATVRVPRIAVSGADAMVRMLKLHGIETIFGLCGDTSLPFYDALARDGSIRHVLSRDER